MAIVDVRILVEGASDVEVVSKALQGLALGSEYNITISAIIPTTNVEIAKSAAAGADLLIIATDADRVGRDLAERLFNELSEMVGHIERMKLPLGHDLEHVDVELVRKELKNTLVRAGLKTLQLLPGYMELRKELLDVKGKYDQLANDYEALYKEYEDLQKKYEELHGEYVRIRHENEGLRELLNKKSRPVKIDDAWKNLFPAEPTPEERLIAIAVEKLGLAGKVIVGQGYIFAEDKGLVDELLKTVYLSLSIREEPPKPPEPPRKEPPKPSEPPKEPEVVADAEIKPDDIEGLLKGL
ncbi:topoisomerase [Thermococcus sp. GR7]|uniref:toprim domain-containing protein n=1 Tax=unclassified Thermococcus TaxID=2627626 RepID=UPI00143161F4|nr:MULTISPECIES: toprim domain-containing protein [unclassified Thermococcus]NJE47761.1 topoisomerase [Thermococcus sp. GR7]NJE78733.1 topoisomerase [Thermococcus sp. GR4]NJF22383.1 topoisomerase [Thermococcus sp. GR5]